MSSSINPLALITADDWGMSPGINDGILDLAKKGVVRRVSCMAKGLYLDHRFSELTSVPGIEIGLHFDLTFEKSNRENLSFVMSALFRPSQVKESVLAAFRSQWSELVSAGLNPTYLDGHHHIHLLPGVLDTILKEAPFAGVKSVRTVCDPTLLFSTKCPIVVLSYLARPKIKECGLATLPCWYPKLERIGLVRFKNALSALKTKTEVIVHPASKNDLAELRIKDSYTEARLDEFKILGQLGSGTLQY